MQQEKEKKNLRERSLWQCSLHGPAESREPFAIAKGSPCLPRRAMDIGAYLFSEHM